MKAQDRGVERPIDQLTLDPANLRKHGERSLAAIAASLSRFGQQRPIVVDANGVVIAGNGVLEAARSLGWKQIRVVVSKLGGAERISYAIADNRTAELSEWDDPALASVLAELPADLALAAGFTADDINALVGRESVDQASPPEEPPQDPVSKPGDLWILGRHRLLVGDCTIEEEVARLMAGDRAVLFATDPPYLVGYDGTNHPQSFKGQKKNKDWSETYGKTWDDADGNTDLYDRFIATAVKCAITENAAWYCWHASRRQAMLEAAWQKAGAFVHCQIIWAKNRPVLTRTWYMWQHEPCLMGWIQGKKPERTSEETLSTVWEMDTIPNGEDRPDHPTPKPIELFAIPMRQHTRVGEICFEPFAGSGTQIIAAERLGRRCFAAEISAAYADVCITRWQEETGQAAVLEGDNKTFAQISDLRISKKRKPRARAA